MKNLRKLSDEELKQELKVLDEEIKKLNAEMENNATAPYQTTSHSEYVSSFFGAERGDHWRPSVMSETESRNSIEWLIRSDIKRAEKRKRKIKEILESREQQAQRQ